MLRRRRRAYARDVKRLSVLQALALAAAVTGAVVLAGGWLVSLLEPESFESIGEGLWWAVTTVTTVGYGDVVPSTGAGRIIGVALMLTGFACLAFVTATMASMIVREVRAEERLIEREEGEVLNLLVEMNARLERLERLAGASPNGDLQRAGQAGRR
jgi:voltage-gated potassium channel